MLFQPFISFFYLVLATSGIDYDIKIWTPTSEDLIFKEKEAMEVNISRRFL